MRGRPPVYIVLPVSGGPAGGAEKRFTQLWCHLLREAALPYEPRLVLEDRLLESLSRATEFPELTTSRSLVVPVDARTLSPMGLRAFSRARQREDARSVFHYVLVAPAPSRAVGKRTLYSITAARIDRINFNTTARALLYASALNSARIDTLDPKVRRHLSTLFPWKQSSISVTPNTSIDLEHYAPGPFEKRRNRLVFLGTFLRKKQAFRLLDQLPEIDATLRKAGIADPEWAFIGRDNAGEGESAVARCTSLREERGINVSAFYSDNPQEELQQSKIFFSVQFLENYPSKSLAEALACGVHPIITDVGQSRRMATEDFASFVSREFTAREISEKCVAVLALDRDTYDAKVAAARSFAAKHFSVGTMVAYYRQLHETLVLG